MAHPFDVADHPHDATLGYPELAEVIVDALPIGVALGRPGEAPIFANTAALQHGLTSAAHSDPLLRPAHNRARPGPASASRGIATALPIEWRQGERTIQATSRSVALGGLPYDLTVSTDITEQRRLEDDLFQRAYFDNLTGLPNRSLMEQSVRALISNDDGAAAFALAFIDVDNFKHINDYYGHVIGDGLLVKIARRIADDIRGTDMLARMGGDELMLLYTPIGSLEAVEAEIGRILARLKEPFFIDGHEIFSSASIGVSLYPLHGRDYDELLGNADNAMYRIKGNTKGGIKFFDRAIGHAATERMKLEQRLRLAVRDRRLCCAFQPKVDFRSERVTGLEVLLRWRDEGGVIHAPGGFVDLAVELGLMDEITLLVLAETLVALPMIDEAFGPETSISINIAAKQANDYKFMRIFANALMETGSPRRFMVELTEEAFLVKSAFQQRVLPMLREIGVKVSIDDFGAGYSSLSALADITADEIKVDRSFITDIHKRARNQIILSAVESLGHALGMTVIVEGVESFEELAYLQAATRIRCAQGYYFAKPLFFEEFAQGRIGSYGPRELQLPRETAASRNWPLRQPKQKGGRIG